MDLQKILEQEGPEMLTPDIPGEIVGEIQHSPTLRRWAHELVHATRFQTVMAHLRQRKIKEANDRIERRAIEGIGCKIASIDPEIYYREELVHGKGCWRDKSFLYQMLRDNPFLRVVTSAKTFITAGIQFGVPISEGRASARPSSKETTRDMSLGGQDARPTLCHGARGEPATAFRSAHETAGAPLKKRKKGVKPPLGPRPFTGMKAEG